MKRLRRLTNQRGSQMAEFALVLAFIFLVALIGVRAFGRDFSKVVTSSVVDPIHDV